MPDSVQKGTDVHVESKGQTRFQRGDSIIDWHRQRAGHAKRSDRLGLDSSIVDVDEHLGRGADDLMAAHVEVGRVWTGIVAILPVEEIDGTAVEDAVEALARAVRRGVAPPDRGGGAWVLNRRIAGQDRLYEDMSRLWPDGPSERSSCDRGFEANPRLETFCRFS